MSADAIDDEALVGGTFSRGEPVKVVVDDHNFRVPTSSGHDTCRLQILRGARSGASMVVVTQAIGREFGCGAMNEAEQFTRTIRDVHFPDVHPDIDKWPPFVWHQATAVEQGRWGDLVLTVFTHDPDRGPSPGWCEVSPSIRAVMEREADAGRGSGWVEPPLHDGFAPWWGDTALVDLPPTSCFRHDCLKVVGQGPMRRRLRRLTVRSCGCWYHGGSWAQATTIAFRALRSAHLAAASLPGSPDPVVDAMVVFEQVQEHAYGGVKALSIGRDPWVREAALSILKFPIKVSVSDHATLTSLGTRPNGEWSFTNGQHRVQAMRDQEVRRTPIIMSLTAADAAPSQVRLLAC